jgi:hypothetical protein
MTARRAAQQYYIRKHNEPRVKTQVEQLQTRIVELEKMAEVRLSAIRSLMPNWSDAWGAAPPNIEEGT